MVEKIVLDHGTNEAISRDDIAKSLDKAIATVIMKISSCVQYGMLRSQHGKGYFISDLFKKYLQPVYENDEKNVLLEMFKNPPLYAKLIDNKDNEILPTEERFANLLKGDPYKLNSNSSDKAARVFFENVNYLDLIDSHRRFKFHKENVRKVETTFVEITQPSKETSPAPKPSVEQNLFILPIPLPNRRKAFLQYPLEDLSLKDIRVIRKAIDFIASSIDTSEVEEVRQD